VSLLLSTMPAVVLRFSFRAPDVLAVLDRVCGEVVYPASIRVEQTSEFVSGALDLWAFMPDVPDFSRPGTPTDNALIESFNGKFRAECPNQHWFMSLYEVRKCEVWRRDYNEVRPHSAIGNKPPISLVNQSAAHEPPRLAGTQWRHTGRPRPGSSPII